MTGCLRLLLFLLYPFLILQFQQAALERLGIPPLAVPLVLVLAIFGSFIQLPLWRSVSRRQLVALNLGGGLIPLLLSVLAGLQIFARAPHHLVALTLIVMASAATARNCSNVVQGEGVVMAPLPPALLSALLASWLTPEVAPLAAYCGGTLGVVLGADLWRLPRILKHGPCQILIGGAGTLDGIIMTGLLATLLAAGGPAS